LTVFIGIVSITNEIISAICVKYIFLSKKALTASSFAAFNNEGDVPPESREALDILILGNFFRSG
jgi:hypothetical protein